MIKNEILLNSGQQNLSGWYWQAENPIAVVLLVHGFGEHISRYEHVAEKFTAKSISVLGVDLIGHGNSTGKRGHVESMKGFYGCIDSMLDYAKQDLKDLPFVLYGHSMGGNIVLNYQLNNKKSEFCCVLASSPWLKLKLQPSAVQLFLAKTMNSIFPSLQQASDLDVKEISSVESVQEDYANDPLNHDRISVRLFNEIYKNGLHVIENATNIDTPVLIAHGDADAITSADASKEFAANCPSATLKLWPDLKHEPHNEHNQDEVIDYYVEWVISNLGS
jgi:acylglycerol lipase